MEKYIKTKFVLCLFIILTGCNSLVNNVVEKATEIDIEIDPKEFVEFKPGILFENFELVPFREPDENKIGDIRKLVVIDSVIFLLDDLNKNVVCYDMFGNFKTPIGGRGRAPDEYITANEFQVLEELKKILVWDNSRKIMNAYDFNGKYLNSQKSDFFAISFYYDNNNYWFYTAGINEEGTKEDQFGLTVIQDKLSSNKFQKFLPANNFYPRTINESNFFKFKNRLVFYYGINNTIYSLSDSEIRPYISIDAGKYTIPYEVFSKFESMDKSLKEMSKSEYIGKISNYLENSRLIYFSIRNFKDGTVINVIYDKERSKYLVYSEVIDDGSNILIGSTPLYIDDDYFYYLMPTYYFGQKGIDEFIIKNSVTKSDESKNNQYRTVLIKSKLKSKFAF